MRIHRFSHVALRRESWLSLWHDAASRGQAECDAACESRGALRHRDCPRGCHAERAWNAAPFGGSQGLMTRFFDAPGGHHKRLLSFSFKGAAEPRGGNARNSAEEQSPLQRANGRQQGSSNRAIK